MAVLLEHPVFLLTLLTFAAFGFVTVAGWSNVRGKHEVKGVTCSYGEMGTKGPGPRGISLCCCVEGVLKQCGYYGANPHHCGNSYSKNKVEYYLALAESAMENGAPCAKPFIQETICGLPYPCDWGDCLLSSSNNRRKRRSFFCFDYQPVSAYVTECAANATGSASNVTDSAANSIFPAAPVLVLSCFVFLQNVN